MFEILYLPYPLTPFNFFVLNCIRHMVPLFKKTTENNVTWLREYPSDVVIKPHKKGTRGQVWGLTTYMVNLEKEVLTPDTLFLSGEMFSSYTAPCHKIRVVHIKTFTVCHEMGTSLAVAPRATPDLPNQVWWPWG